MSRDVIQAQYEQLEAIAARFRRQAEQSADAQRSVTRDVQALRNGGWQGRGATSFFKEIDTVVYPAMQRLRAALVAGDEVTREIIRIMREAEGEAAQGFRGNGVADGGHGSSDTGSSSRGGSARAGASDGNGASDDEGPQAKLNVGLYEWDLADPGSRFAPSLGFKYGDSWAIGEAETSGQTSVGGVDARGKASAQFGTLEAAVGVGVGKDGVDAGLYVESYLGKAGASGVLGDRDLGLTGGAEVRGPGAKAHLGIYHNEFGALIGASLATAEGSIGTNVAGVNVGVKGEVGLKAEIGGNFSRERVELKLPIVSVGLTFGGAL